MENNNTLSHVEKLQTKLNCNYDKIAEGFYNIIPDSEKACMRLGMLPAKFMELLEKTTREKFEKLVSPIRAFYKDTFDFDAEYLAISMKECDDFVTNNTRETMREVSIKLIGIATAKGLCIV